MNNFYIKAFANNQIDGVSLLNLRPYELEELGIISVGHQEIILEAVEHLKNFVRFSFSVLFLSQSTGNNKMIHLFA